MSRTRSALLRLGSPLGLVKCGFGALHEFGAGHFKSSSDPQNDCQGRLSLAPFEFAEVGPVDASSEGHLILGNAEVYPRLSGDRSKRQRNVWLERSRSGRSWWQA